MADFRIETRDAFGLVSIMARKGVSADQVGRALDIAAPTAPAIVTASSGLSLIGTGNGTWLAYADEAPASWADDLRDRLVGIASVSDQSSGYSVQRISGDGARKVLQRGAAIDLEPDVFGPGSAATTVISHIGVIVWQLDAQPTYDVATFRSFADSVRHWLDEAAKAL